IVQDTIYLGWFVVIISVPTVLKVGLTTGLDNIHITIHDVILRSGQFFHNCTSSTVVPVGMADEKNLGIAEVEPKFLNALANYGNRTLKAAIDENVSLRSGDQVRSQPLASYVVNVAGHMMRRKRSGPVRMGLSCQAHRQKHHGWKN